MSVFISLLFNILDSRTQQLRLTIAVIATTFSSQVTPGRFLSLDEKSGFAELLHPLHIQPTLFPAIRYITLMQKGLGELFCVFFLLHDEHKAFD